MVGLSPGMKNPPMRKRAVAHDPVNPSHYKDQPVETIDLLRATLSDEQFFGFCIGNWVKYRDRDGRKDSPNDKGKAEWYKQMAMHVRHPDRYPDPRSPKAEG